MLVFWTRVKVIMGRICARKFFWGKNVCGFGIPPAVYHEITSHTHLLKTTCADFDKQRTYPRPSRITSTFHPLSRFGFSTRLSPALTHTCLCQYNSWLLLMPQKDLCQYVAIWPQANHRHLCCTITNYKTKWSGRMS